MSNEKEIVQNWIKKSRSKKQSDLPSEKRIISYLKTEGRKRLLNPEKYEDGDNFTVDEIGLHFDCPVSLIKGKYPYFKSLAKKLKGMADKKVIDSITDSGVVYYSALQTTVETIYTVEQFWNEMFIPTARAEDDPILDGILVSKGGNMEDINPKNGKRRGGFQGQMAKMLEWLIDHNFIRQNKELDI